MQIDTPPGDNNVTNGSGIDFGLVQQVHGDYLRAGADIVTSANFWTNRPRLEAIGLGERWQEYAKVGGENAVKARDAGNHTAYARVA